jgi:hypothetical protein
MMELIKLVVPGATNDVLSMNGATLVEIAGSCIFSYCFRISSILGTAILGS